MGTTRHLQMYPLETKTHLPKHGVWSYSTQKNKYSINKAPTCYHIFFQRKGWRSLRLGMGHPTSSQTHRNPEHPIIITKQMLSWNCLSVAEHVSKSRLGRKLLIWHFLSSQSNHPGLWLSSLNPLQTLTHNDPILNLSLVTPVVLLPFQTNYELTGSKYEQWGKF